MGVRISPWSPSHFYLKDNIILKTFDFDIQKFTNEIQELCDRNVDFLDAIITWCLKNNIELETLVPILKKDVILRNKLFHIAESINLLKK